MVKLEIFDNLSTLFNKNGFRLYIIGGTSRDLLLGEDVDDYDFVTDATPSEMKEFLPDANYRFEKYGTVRLKIDGFHIDITTLRKESSYVDARHPLEIEFTKSLDEDYKRRDFTINAIYIDENYNVIDKCGGVSDLNDGVIRFIGDPLTRIKEDPLRIIRAERFKTRFNFAYAGNLGDLLRENSYLLDKLNPEKIKEEKKKFKSK